MSYLLALPLLLGQLTTSDEPAKREPAVRFGPCGVYDIAELEDYFLVRVEQNPTDADPERISVAITLIDTAPEDDPRRPFPMDGLALEVKNDAKKTIASSPLHWESRPYSLAMKAERFATFTVSRSAAKQVILNRDANLIWLEQPHLLVTFNSLEKKPK